MGLKIWLNTGLVDEADAKVSVFDHGLLYGDGVFEGIRVYSRKVFELEAHIKRLYESANAIRLTIPMTKTEMVAAIETTVKANGIVDGYIRLLVTRGVGCLGLNPFTCQTSSVIIIAGTIQLYPDELYEKGMRVISATTVRNHPLAIPPQVKSLNYLNNILAKIEALDSNVPEAIMYNHEGYVAEATGDNVFIVRNGVVCVPPVQAGSLEGPRIREALENLDAEVAGVIMRYRRPFSPDNHETLLRARQIHLGEIRDGAVVFAHEATPDQTGP